MAITEVYLSFLQPARPLLGSYRTDSQPHHPRDVVWLSFKPKHSKHDLLPTTTPGKAYRARSTSVYCLCQLYEGIRHRWDVRTVAAAEEIWMPQKVHNHDRKSAYRNDGERQEWRGGLAYICYNKRCQAGVHNGSHAFPYLSVSNARRRFQWPPTSPLQRHDQEKPKEKGY